MRVRKKPTQKRSGHTRSSQKLWHTTPLSPKAGKPMVFNQSARLKQSPGTKILTSSPELVLSNPQRAQLGVKRHQVELNCFKIGAGPRMEVGKVTFGIAPSRRVPFSQVFGLEFL